MLDLRTRPDREMLRRLTGTMDGAGVVVSVYVNLDPSLFATHDARLTAMHAVIDEAARKAHAIEGDLDHAARMTLREDVERVRGYLAHADLEGTRGIAVFVAGRLDALEAVHLPDPVENQAVVADAPALEQLIVHEARDGWAVLLVNRRRSRLLRGEPGQLTEVDRLDDDVPGRHDQGGLSQARFQRHVDELAAKHLRGTAEMLARHHRARRLSHLLVAGPDPACPELIELLEPELRALLCCRVEELDVENATVAQVVAAATPSMLEEEARRRDELLARLQEGLGTGGRAAAGLGEVLETLNERRVEALLLDEGCAAAGVECPSCSWLGADPDATECPLDGTPLVQRPDVVERAAARALFQNAEIVAMHDRPELGPHGGIAALLRF